MTSLNLFTLSIPVSPLFSIKNEPKETALFTEPEPAKWATQSFQFQPDPIQTEILNHPAHRLMLLCTRQFGKTQITALKALHFALTHPRALVVVASPCERRSAEWLLRITHLLHTLGLPHRRDGIHQFSAVLPNQARLIGLPGVADNNRGYPAHLLIFEEAAFVPDPLWKSLTASIVATQGRLWLISSAGSQFGFFHHQWHETEIPWSRFRVTADQCPRISPESLAEQRILLGESDFNREFQCEFTAEGPQVISLESLNRAFDPTVPPINQGKPLWYENRYGPTRIEPLMVTSAFQLCPLGSHPR